MIPLAINFNNALNIELRPYISISRKDDKNTRTFATMYMVNLLNVQLIDNINILFVGFKRTEITNRLRFISTEQFLQHIHLWSWLHVTDVMKKIYILSTFLFLLSRVAQPNVISNVIYTQGKTRWISKKQFLLQEMRKKNHV